MNRLGIFLNKLVTPIETDENEARFEFMTRVILLMMGSVMIIFTPIVLAIWGGNFQDLYTLLILSLINIPIILGWFLVQHRYWRLASHIIVVTFLFIGYYGTFLFGFGTTFLLFYVLAIIMAGMYHEEAQAFIVTFAAIIGATSIAWVRSYNLDEVLTPAITMTGLLTGITLLQRLSQSLLNRSLEQSRSLSKELQLEIKDRLKAEQEIHKLNTELEQRVHQRTAQLEVTNRELESFAYSISHDLRAPLRALIGFSNILLEDYFDSLDHEGQKYLNHVITASHTMDDLINALLTLSRIGRHELSTQSVDLTQLANIVSKELIIEEPRERQIEFTALECLPAIADESMMRILLSNLITNAIKFTRKMQPSVIEFGCQDEQGRTVYYLKDNGVGFDMQYAQKLFAPFQRLHRKDEYEGAGIGLAIVQRIINRHNGHIWVTAKPDQGATFFFTIQ